MLKNFLAVLFCIAFPSGVVLAAETGAARPNIVFVLADDLGWADAAFHGGNAPTPHLDRLARDSVELTQHYVAPVCSPTRCGFMTGRYWSRFGINAPHAERALPWDTVTIPKAMKTMGYDTCLSGKWHLGSKPAWGPSHFGFDHSYGSLGGGGGPWDHRYKQGPYTMTWDRSDVLVDEPGHVTDLIVDEAIHWIESRSSAPFFLYVPFSAVHLPIREPQAYLDAVPESIVGDVPRQYAASVMHLDDAVGKIIDTLEKTGHRDDTLLVFTSDNGGSTVAQEVIAQKKDTLQLTLPPVIYAVPNVEISLYFDNVVLTPTLLSLNFSVDCGIGQTESRRWVVNPKATEVGTHPLTVRVKGSDGSLLGTATTQLKVSSADAGNGKSIRLLIVGDSLTNASLYPNEISRLFQSPGNPKLKMLGTHRPPSVADGVAHEGYGGWTWSRFVSHYEPHPDPQQRKFSSPFVFLDSNEQPKLDVARYINEHCDGQAPDYVVFLLGINDCFGASPDDRQAMDATIDGTFKHADTLLADFRKAAPQAHFGICLTPAPNSRQEAFQANYQDKYTRWGWKRIQHRLVQRQLDHFADDTQRNLSLIPTQVNIDPVDGYPVNNGVHPNQHGYQQIGTSIYVWLKSRL